MARAQTVWLVVVWSACAVELTVGFWGSGTTDPPVVAMAIAPSGEMFSAWPSEGERGDGGGVGGGVWEGREGQLRPDCDWWNGTHYYDPSLCNPFAVTRLPRAIAERAIERATRCAATATTDCVLNGEIGFNMPAAFLYDPTEGMRMLVAPKVLPVDGAIAKTIRLQDPEGEHPNQLFEFNDSVRVEYLRGGTRTLESEELRGNDAYCLQALRRATVPTCWEGID